MKSERIRIIVRTPNYIPGPFYICGSIKTLGNWTKHIPLKPFAEDEYSIEFQVTSDELKKLQFKFTCGDFDSVELDINRQEIQNRALSPHQQKLEQIELEIQNIRGFNKTNVSTMSEFGQSLGEFSSEILGNSRNVTVVYPPSYHSASHKKFPILYLHDGNNMFDSSQSYGGVEWALDKTAHQLMKANIIEELILVGIANTSQREAEYTPTKVRNRGGLGPSYIKSLVTEIIPHVESTLRVKTEDRGLMGSSYGGLVTLLAAKNNPCFFSKLGVISPSLAWDKEWIINNFDIDCLSNSRLWMDIGSKEFGAPQRPFGEKYVKRVHKLHRKFRKLSEKDYAFYVDSEAVHNEMSWNKRVHLPLIFLYGKSSLDWGNFINWRTEPLCTWLSS